MCYFYGTSGKTRKCHQINRVVCLLLPLMLYSKLHLGKNLPNPPFVNHQISLLLNHFKKPIKTPCASLMKLYPITKVTFLFIAISTLLSCNNDEKNNSTIPETQLLGVWQRSDFSEEYDYKLYFNTESNGYSTEYIAQPDGTAISDLRPFSWSSSETTLTLDYDDGATDATPFTINAAGQLVASGISNLPFNKL